MKLKKFVVCLLVAVMALTSLSGCARKKDLKHEIIMYFPNWKLGEENGNVSDIPWDKVTYINHAFWEVYPTAEAEQTTFERRELGLEPRTEFTVVSTLPEADEVIFTEYEKFHKKYPDVNIMISVGGWSACGFFSEMAYTEAGRASFIGSCVQLIKDNPWIAGIDIDWEYPAGSNDGERWPEGEGDEGCPIWGTQYEDRMNFTQFLKEFKETLDKEFGEGRKKLTACASSSTGWTLPNQDWAGASQYLDYINIMTYDMAGDWDGVTGHASSAAGAKTAMAYFINNDIPGSKLNLGSPFYATGFMMAEDSDFSKIVGAPIAEENDIDKEMLTVPFIRKVLSEAVEVGTPGWHAGYDEKQMGAYVYNDDPSSEYYRWYLSYEDERAIDGKYALIEKYNLAGIIVWEVTQDSTDHELTKYLFEKSK